MNKKICLYLDRSRIFRWHGWLADALTAAGCDVSIMYAPETHPLPHYYGALFELERIIYRVKGTNALDPINTLIEHGVNEPFDAVVDFARETQIIMRPLPGCRRSIIPRFNGIPGEIGAMAGLLSDSPVIIEIHDNRRPFPWTAHPASVDYDILSRSLDNILSCTVGLILKTLTTESVITTNHNSCVKQPATFHAVMAQATHNLAYKAKKYIEILATGQNRSPVIAWRKDTTSLLDKGSTSFSVLPDDGQRYYADPFPFRNNIFFEDFPYATNRGRISITTVENGVASVPRPVLEEPFHLSYPFVFEHEGEFWMIPESGEARGIYLYRAEQFPYKWKREGCLIDNIDGYDATLLRHDGRFWLFVSERMWNSSSWDTLSLFSSTKLTGPWLPHRHNPIMIDAAVSRSGGAIFHRGDEIIRVAQDNSRNYGDGISLCRINALGTDEYSQTLIGSIAVNGFGCHTYNNYAGLEAIDVFGRVHDREVIASFKPTRDFRDGTTT